MPLFARSPTPATDPPGQGTPAPRRLFLDDDPARAEVFLGEYPDAVWVQTAAECIARLEERWDEVHLDHDLGGEHFVEQSRDDCGMEVVRWLCLHPRPHLKQTRFHVHSHNPKAAMMMGMQMMMNGFQVSVWPFGAPEPMPESDAEPFIRFAPFAALGRLLRRIFRRENPGDLAAGFTLPRPDRLPLEHFDFDWLPAPAKSRDAEANRDAQARPAPGPPRSS